MSAAKPTDPVDPVAPKSEDGSRESEKAKAGAPATKPEDEKAKTESDLESLESGDRDHDEDDEPSSAPIKIKPRRPKPTLWQRATYRWTAITAVMAVLLVIYTQHPYYLGGQFSAWRPVFTTAFVMWLLFGLFYIRATLTRFHQMRYTMRDGGLHLLLLAKAWQEKKFWRVAKNRRVRTTLLGILVKSFFTPLMVDFWSGHANTICDLWLKHKHLGPLKFNIPHARLDVQIDVWFSQLRARIPDMIPHASDFAGTFQPWTRAEFSWLLDLLYNLVFFVDCGWAILGYSGESRWLGNKTRSVEPTPFGWLVCLACYPPFNNSLGTYLPLDGQGVATPVHFNAFVNSLYSFSHGYLSYGGTPEDFHEGALLLFRAVSVGLFMIYASATVSFGFKFSNLTNRGVVSRGPYALVRHPAYLCKCSAWWLEHLPTITITKAIFLSMLCGVYALRAWTEERHLGMDADYRAYKKKVPWIFIPGVF